MPQEQADSMDMQAAKVLVEVALFAGMGMERAMAGKRYSVDVEAIAFWTDRYTTTIPNALKSEGANWDQDRKVVNSQAEELGRFAAEFALAGWNGTEPVRVTRAHVIAASNKVMRIPTLCGYCTETRPGARGPGSNG